MMGNVIKDHRRLEFPSFPDDEELCEFIADLAEVDAYYFGLAESAVPQKQAEIDLKPLEVIEARLMSVDSARDERTYKYCVQYVGSLRKLAESLANRS